MGVLSDVFAATDAELNDDVIEHGPLRSLPTVEGKGAGPENFPIWLRAIGASESEADGYEQPVRPPKKGGPWVFQVPPRILSELVAADDARLLAIRCAWLDTTAEEFAADPLFGVIPDWFDELVALCRGTVGTERKLYLWVCL